MSSSLLASAYLGLSPVFNFATVICNGTDGSMSCTGPSDLLPFLIFFSVFMIIGLIISIIMLVGIWKTFKKAGEPRWACIVPVYNYVVMLRIVRKPWWWVFLFFIPGVNIVITIIVAHDTAKSFGYDIAFMFGLIFLPFIFYPILGFGDAKYVPIRAHA